MSSIISALEKALETNPSDWHTRLALAEACLQENLDSKALALLDEPTELPQDRGEQIAVARCYRTLDTSKARAILKPILDAEPAHAAAHHALAAVALQDGNTRTATRHYLTATSLDPSLADLDPDLAHACELAIPESSEGRDAPSQGRKHSPRAPSNDGTETPFTITPADTINDKDHEDHEGEVAVVVEHVDTAESLLEDHLKELQEEAELIHRKDMRNSKLHSIFLTALVHLAAILLLSLIVISVPRNPPPEIVAVAAPTMEIDTPEKKKVEMPTTKAKPTSASVMPNIINSLNVSTVSVPSVPNAPETDQAVFGSSFRPSLNFGPTGNEGQPMLFGEPIEGTTLGVILDVSGSMAEFLPKVIREIDRNFDKASIVFVNNAMLRSSDGSATEIRPIATDDVVPVVDGLRTPYWFLWHDLPRKAEQASVDRLIDLFKTRQNSYLAVGGNDRVTAAMDYLRSLGIDALYVFSDFQDFVDEDAAVENARKLSKAGVKTYVQPAQVETEYLEVMSSKIADRTDGKELPPLISLDIKEEAPVALLAAVNDPVLVEIEGVHYATARETRYGKEFYEFRSAGSGFDVIEVFEHKHFDLVLYGPSARAEIFLKTEDGYILHPISFRYHSRKWFMNDRGDLTWRNRKWLRNQEPPVLEGNEITWKMILEDELEFEVWFVFNDNSFMATYAAELAPEEFERRTDDASIAFHIPPLAVQRNDIYYSADFPQGRNLDELREAAAPNRTLFNLSTKEADRYAASWALYGFQRGKNDIPHNVLCRSLPNGILDAIVRGPSFGPRILTVASKTNDILLNAHGHRADIELWEGFAFRLTRPRDQTRHRLTKTKAFELTIE